MLHDNVCMYVHNYLVCDNNKYLQLIMTKITPISSSETQSVHVILLYKIIIEIRILQL